MKARTLTLMIILTAIVLTPVVMAAPDGPRGGGNRQGMRDQWQGPGAGGFGPAQMLLGRMGEQLNLTDEQKESIKAISEECKADLQAGREAVREAMQALNDAAEKGDEAAIKTAGKAAGDALTKQALHRAEVSKKINAVLTDEQKTKLAELKAQMRERMEERRQKGPRQQDGQGPRRGQRGPGQGGQRGPRHGAGADDTDD